MPAIQPIALAKLVDANGQTVFQWQADLPIEYGHASLRDGIWSACFGALQSALSDKRSYSRVVVDLSRIGWADPLPLLAIATALVGVVEKFDYVVDVYLGVPAASDRRRGAFLRFLAEHRFLRAMRHAGNYSSSEPDSARTSRTRFHFDGRQFETTDELQELELELESPEYPLTYDDSLCVRARVFEVPLEGGQSADALRSTFVSGCLDELRNFGLKQIFATRPEYVDILIYKFRVILYELIENVCEHAFVGDASSELGAYAGVYARVRRRIAESSRQNAWERARTEEKASCPLMNRFAVTANSDWIELFYYDPGRGLLADLDSWAAGDHDSGREDVARIIRRIRPSTNKLHVLSRWMFGERLSRFGRVGRTEITGLQHIGLVLASAHDFARLCVGREWAGDMHPWKDAAQDNIQSTAINYSKQNRYASLPNTRGTTWHFCVHVHSYEHVLPEYWVAVGDDVRRHLVATPPVGALPIADLRNWKIYDERELAGRIVAGAPNEVDDDTNSFVWLPGDGRKQSVHKWLEVLRSRTDDVRWIIADLHAYQAGRVAEVLLREKFGRNITIYLVTNDWRCACLIGNEVSRANADPCEAQRFMDGHVDLLFRLLRTCDSAIFWEGIPSELPDGTGEHDPPFVYELVDWEGSDGKIGKLYGYLELTQALIKPMRAAVSRRALARTWHLFFPGTRCEAADTLLAGLLPDGSQSSMGRSAVHSQALTIVSSVLVTGSTANLKRLRPCAAMIHLLRHEHTEFDPSSSAVSLGPIALDWMSRRPTVVSPASGKLPYQRIPGTPFIGRGGPKAIPIRRFDFAERQIDGEFKAFQKSLYGEAPKEMYEHFLRLGILKLGHWRYGGHHHLFTVNLGKAYDLEKIDTGPLIRWLTKQFDELRVAGVPVLIYPSHIVTDEIVRDLKARRPNCLPTHVIPIHFLSRHSQSSIRISSLTYDRIKDILAKFPEMSSQRSVVLFDDGTVTGKVAREVEDLVKNSGVSTVYTVTIVNRTGLPLYRKLIMKSRQHRRQYWRWDVPSLGGTRTCPLCRALDQARLIADPMPDGDAKLRVLGWIESWGLHDVVRDWEQHGLTPMALTRPRPMTFGKEWLPDGTEIPYKVTHTTTTTLAAMVSELMRITTYKRVGLKFADKPAGTEPPYQDGNGSYVEPSDEQTIWNRVRLETLTSQVLLFFDDLDSYELEERFVRIAQILIRDPETYEMGKLAALTILLVDSESAGRVLTRILPAVCDKRIDNPEGSLMLGYLIARARARLLDLLEKEGLDFSARRATLQENLLYAWRPFTERSRDATSAQKAHLLTLVLLLGDKPGTTHCGFLRIRTAAEQLTNHEWLLHDLQVLELALRDLSPHLYESSPTQFRPEMHANIVRDLRVRLRETTELALEAAQAQRRNLHIALFGSDGLAAQFQKETVMSVMDFHSFFYGRVEEWIREIESKIAAKPGDAAAIKKRWSTSHGLRPPNIEMHFSAAENQHMLILPGVQRLAILEQARNVVHSPTSLDVDNSGAPIDIRILLSKKNDGQLTLILEMATEEPANMPYLPPKLSEKILGSVLDLHIAHEFFENGGRWARRTTIPLVAVTDLGRVVL